MLDAALFLIGRIGGQHLGDILERAVRTDDEPQGFHNIVGIDEIRRAIDAQAELRIPFFVRRTGDRGTNTGGRDRIDLDLDIGERIRGQIEVYDFPSNGHAALRPAGQTQQ